MDVLVRAEEFPVVTLKQAMIHTANDVVRECKRGRWGMKYALLWEIQRAYATLSPDEWLARKAMNTHRALNAAERELVSRLQTEVETALEELGELSAPEFYQLVSELCGKSRNYKSVRR